MEGFFYQCCKIDEIEVIDVLMSRYGNIQFLESMDWDTALKVIEKATEKENRKKWYLVWVQQLPWMSEDNYESFDEFYDKVTLKNVDMRPTEVIQAELDEIEKLFEE